MSHRTWIASGLGLLLAASVSAQDVSGGFPDSLFGAQPTLGSGVFAPYPLAVGDLNEDGLADLAVQDESHANVALFPGEPEAGLGSAQLVSMGMTNFARVLITDVDGDGHLDFLINGIQPAMRWIRGHGDGSFDASQAAGPGPGIVDLVATDVDGDGLADMLDAQIGGHLQFRKGAGTGSFANPLDVGVTEQPSDLMVGDLDDDGVLDCALVDGAQLVVRQGLGAGAFGPAQAVSSSFANGLEAADMDLDGQLDLVERGAWNVATILHGQGSLQYAAPFPVTMQGGMKDLTVADLDADGVPDLLATQDNGPTMLVSRRMNVDGPAGPSHQHPLGFGPFVIGFVARDFDGDSLPDAAMSNYLPGQVAVALNQLGPFIGLGHELPSAQGTPTLKFFGTPAAGHILSIQATAPMTPVAGFLCVGLQPVHVPFHGGTLVPDALLTVDTLAGSSTYFVWPAGVPAGSRLYMQTWFKLAGGGFAASDAWVIISE